MCPLEHNTRSQGPEVNKTGPTLDGRFIVRFTKKTLTLLMSAALVLADVPEFGLQADASMVPATTKGSQENDTKEVA